MGLPLGVPAVTALPGVSFLVLTRVLTGEGSASVLTGRVTVLTGQPIAGTPRLLPTFNNEGFFRWLTI